MSKNVAVFVDVANIFYAAKAAGVDIDYVTLLKAATAGRDFVRAYAYTGLDPENENQRQFHSFLARSGYKVISKDIRKYGDGRIKANLDIELVVDMMKTARNLDIAVVVSGDGDFASAIRAVQEMGVRVEVISFRGNTSSDLIDVADLFTDIAGIARVEKGSVRSGRRVAAEGDLSMTAVPEKETEGAPRRRGRTRAAEERPVAVAASVERDAQPTNVIAMPGERLSRAPEADEAEDQEEQGAAAGEAGESEEARRRRRRRGGRGRGRGRRGEEGMPGDELAPVGVDAEDLDIDEPQPAQPAHHTFGSVWDSQIGVPSAATPPMDTLAGEPSDEEDFDEPEVPEYLLAERRQRGQTQGGRGGRPIGRGGNRSAYQAALDRERFGRSAPPQPSFGGSGGSGGSGGGRSSDRGPDRGRDRGRGGRPQGGRPPRMDERAPMRAPSMEPRNSNEPWSEVPPELEQLLRAELSRKQPEPAMPMSQPAPTSSMAEPVMSAEPETPAKATRRRTTTRTKAAEAPAEASTDTETPAAKATRARTTKASATKPTTRTRKAATSTSGAAATVKKPATRRKTATTSAPAADNASDTGEG